MKQKNKKGYYAALFSCLGIAALVIGVSTIGLKSSEDKIVREKTENNTMQTEEQGTPVLMNNTPSLEVTKEEQNKMSNDGAEKQMEEAPKESTTAPVEKPVPKPEEQKKEEPAKEEASEEAFAEETDMAQTGMFDKDLVLQSPLAGDIVMDFSIDHAIYDVTLDQYRTNDTISISGKVGDEVKAAGDGVVESVSNDSETGKTVVINHNNGWKTTYSQLQENVAVSEGDKVKTGQVIGAVGEPTKYGVLLGSHLDFGVTRDGEVIDPKVAMAQ